MYSRNDIERLIKSNDKINEFIEGKTSSIEYTVDNISIYIYKEGVGASYYYKLPWNNSINYETVRVFMEYAMPIISNMIETYRQENLTHSDF